MYGVGEQYTENRVIVVADEIDLRLLRGLEFAKAFSSDIVVFASVATEAQGQMLRTRWEAIQTGIPLEARISPDGSIAGPLLSFLDSCGCAAGADGTITVVLPRLAVTKWWQRLLHNQASRYVERRLAENPRVKVVVVPVEWQQDDLDISSVAPS